MPVLSKLLRKAAAYGSGVTLGAAALLGTGIYISSRDQPPYKVENPFSSVLLENDPNSSKYWRPENRQAILNKLEASSMPKTGGAEGKKFDLLIIGGGATGAGCALDAATRGLNVALVEAWDFSSGTSSKSTKLVHGGVRYLEKAFWNLDLEQFRLVNSALKERGTFLKLAPHLSGELPLLIPAYSFWQGPYYYAGTLAYALIAKYHGDALKSCGYLTKAAVLNELPFLCPTNLIGAVSYSDGTHNDSRMNTLLAITAAAHGATVANYVEVVKLLKKPREVNVGKYGLGNNEIYGAVVKDKLTGKEFEVHAKGVISATGPLSDSIREMDLGEGVKKMVVTSRGTHIVVPSSYCPTSFGLLDARSSDGRVLFILPWENSCLIGTTDVKCSPEWVSKPSREEIQWMLDEANMFFIDHAKLKFSDILSVWSGIRPMVTEIDSNKVTQEIARNHVISLTEGGLLVINGGKWTTYREMAEDTIDRAVEVFDLGSKISSGCVTPRVPIIGSYSWFRSYDILLTKLGIPSDIAKHLSQYYGDRSWEIVRLMKTDSDGNLLIKRLHPEHPYLEEEVTNAVINEYAVKPGDVLCRRTRFAFIDMRAAYKSIPKIANIMGKELNWSSSKISSEISEAEKELIDMGYSIIVDNNNS